jgi:hypothetical protein
MVIAVDDGGFAPKPPPQAFDGAALERGGVLLRLDEGEGGDAFGFVPAEVARRLTALTALTVVPGARPPVAGIALADGAVVTVLRIGQREAPGGKQAYAPGDDWLVPGADRALLCDLGGFDVALTGATVVATGVFDAAPVRDGVLWRGEVVPVLDVRALYARAEAVKWAERASRTGATHPPVERVACGAEGDEGRLAMLPAAPGEGGESGGGR